ncbi:hypothetical protein C8F01DRAFT_1288616 [Mycena amicta]|nr:hypothetical protein C8F01DRAFT_1288616 [Mycena amicta]
MSWLGIRSGFAQLLLVVLLSTVLPAPTYALSFNPSDFQAAVGKQITITWTTSASDPNARRFSVRDRTAELRLISPAPNQQTVGQADVNIGNFFVLFEIPQVVPGNGYVLEFVSSEDSGNVLATTETFAIGAGDRSAPPTTTPTRSTSTETSTSESSPGSSAGSSTTTSLPTSTLFSTSSLASASTSTSTSASNSATSASSESVSKLGGRPEQKLSRGSVAGIALVAILFPIIAGLSLWLWILRRRRRSRGPRPTPFDFTAAPDRGEFTETTRSRTASDDLDATLSSTVFTVKASEPLDTYGRDPEKGDERAEARRRRLERRTGNNGSVSVLDGLPGSAEEVAVLRERVQALERRLVVSASDVQRESVASESPPPAYNDTR